MTEVEKAYLAAFIDGEGTIGVHFKGYGGDARYTKEAKRIRAYVSVANTNKPVMEWIHSLIGGARWSENPGIGSRNKTLYRLQVQSIRAVYDIICEIEPYLRVKKDAAILVKAFCESRLNKKSGSSYTYTEEEKDYCRRVKNLHIRS